MKRVSGSERLRDVAAALLVVGGASLYLYAYSGMRSVMLNPVPAPREEWVLQRYARLWNLSRAGIALLVLGMLVAAWSYWRLRQRRLDSEVET